MKYLYLLTFILITTSTICLGQTDLNRDLNIKKLGEEYGLDNIGDSFDILYTLRTKKDKEIINKEIIGEWTYEYSIKSSGIKYKSKNAIKKFRFDTTGYFLELKKNLTDSIKGIWIFQNGLLTLKFSDPYFKDGKPDNLALLSDYEISLISLDNEIHYVHKIDENSLYIVSTVVISGEDQVRTVRFKKYIKSNYENNE